MTTTTTVPREATRADRPWGTRMAQCTICWRMFTGDATCEKHKPYRRPVTAGCKDPSTAGLTPFERRGLVVWGTGSPRGLPSPAGGGNGANPSAAGPLS